MGTGWWKGKPAGIKILWLWAFGTAGILVTTVTARKMQSMQRMMKASDQQQQQLTIQEDSDAGHDGSSSSGEVIREDKL